MHIKKKITALTISTLLACSLLSGCAKNTDTTSDTSGAVLDFSNTTLSGVVTSVDDNVITLSLSNGMRGGFDNGQGMPGNSSGDNNQTPPEKPSGDNDNQTPPEQPSGDNDNQAPPEQPSGDNDENATTFTLTITDESLLQDASLSDITNGTWLTISFDGNNQITSISIMENSGFAPGNDMGGGNAPMGGNGSGTVNTGTGANTINESTEENGKSYSSENSDENALRIEGDMEYSGTNLTVSKSSGDTSDTESSDFYGLNAGILSLDGAATTLSDSVISTNAQGANGVFAYGSTTSVNISNTSITTVANNSGGIDATGGATITAENLNIETSGNSSAAIRSDRGGGNLKVTNGTYTTNGTGSPAVYCTADITVTDATLNANASEGIVIEGKNSVTIENCEVTGNMQGTYQGDENENLHGIMIYQSMSGDADEGEASFTANGGSITALNGDLIYSTNTSSTVSLNNVALTLANDTLLRVCGNDGVRGWGQVGNNGADMKFTTTNQTMAGKIIVDEISSLELTLSEYSSFEGSINEAQEGGTISVTLDDNSTWKLTGDSYITSFEGSMDNVDLNGYNLYVNGTAME